MSNEKQQEEKQQRRQRWCWYEIIIHFTIAKFMSRIYCSRFPLLIITTTHQNYKGIERERRENIPTSEEMK